jgi:aspartokinase/homoserine dehydrogenase 1
MKSNANEIKFLKNRSIIKFEGQDFLGEIGIDGRVFKALTFARISVGIISQQAVENGLSILVHEDDSEKAVNCLIEEFATERKSGKVSQIYSINNVSVIGFVADDLNKILSELARNNVFPLLLNQNSSEKRINIVVTSSQDEKTKNFNKKGFDNQWSDEVFASEKTSNVEELINFSKENQLENLIVVDNTASTDFVKNYHALAENGFDLVSSNKIFNTLPIEEYRKLRYTLNKNNKRYLYETNVGAGLPLIDTIKLLHLSGENITRIKGVFSGTLSYVFNNFSLRDDKFSTIVNEALEKGFTEPDPREDLSGNDVARKLLILARELDLINEFNDINIQNLVPEALLSISKQEFLSRLEDLDEEYDKIKKNQEPGHVLRYVGDLHGDLQKEKGNLDVKLISVPATSALGQLKGSDYGENPIVIMGAGAGAKVTARGVFGDILRLSETK